MVRTCRFFRKNGPQAAASVIAARIAQDGQCEIEFRGGVKMSIRDRHKVPISRMPGTVLTIRAASIGASLPRPPAKEDKGGEAR